MKNYIFSIEAISEMLVECYREENYLETGGVLIGPRKQQGIVTNAIPSSYHAERERETYCQSEADVDVLNRKLKENEKRHYTFKGYFHRHPRGLDGLTGGDVETCAKILNDKVYDINNELLMCIITESAGAKSPVLLFVVSLNNEKNIIVRKASIKILRKECIEDCMEYFKEKGESNASNTAG